MNTDNIPEAINNGTLFDDVLKARDSAIADVQSARAAIEAQHVLDGVACVLHVLKDRVVKDPHRETYEILYNNYDEKHRQAVHTALLAGGVGEHGSTNVAINVRRRNTMFEITLAPHAQEPAAVPTPEPAAAEEREGFTIIALLQNSRNTDISALRLDRYAWCYHSQSLAACFEYQWEIVRQLAVQYAAVVEYDVRAVHDATPERGLAAFIEHGNIGDVFSLTMHVPNSIGGTAHSIYPTFIKLRDNYCEVPVNLTPLSFTHNLLKD